MSDEPKVKHNLMRIVGINLLVLISYTIICRLTAINARGEDALGSAALLALLIGIHMLFCLVTAVVNRKNTNYWLLSALLVLLIGFSSCWAAFSI